MKIFLNGVIHTMAPSFTDNASALSHRIVQALVIHQDRIVLTGSNEEALRLKTADAQVIDLGGKCVIPGLVDSHMHLLLGEVCRHRLDLSGARSCDEIAALGRAYLQTHPLEEGEWLIGYGFNQDHFDSPELPDVRTADAISTDVPVLLDRVCGHIGAANHAALQAAGFTENTRIAGGSLDLDAEGHLNGILREAALDVMKKFTPRLGLERVLSLIKSAGAHMAAQGLTGVHSDDLGPEGTDWPVLAEAFRLLEAQESCPLRLWEEWQHPDYDSIVRKVLSQPLRSFEGSDYLKLANIKLISDGSLGARTASMREDYADDPGNRGIRVFPQAVLNEIVALCHHNHLQVACHAIGDASAEAFVNAVELAMKKEPGRLHHRIVHCQFGDAALYARMASLGIGADIQPVFVPTDAAIVQEHVGDKRTASSYAWKTLLNQGVVCGGGSDNPVEDYNPIYGIHCAVNRPDRHEDAYHSFLPEECLSVEEAVRLFTVGPAALVHASEDLGTLEAGKLADLVVLDQDIFTVPTEQIRNIHPVLTMVGGHVTYQAST